jgi:type IX secretion system substrate protein
MRRFIIITLSLILATNAFGQISYNQEFQVNTYTTNRQEQVAIAALSNNNSVVCWSSLEQEFVLSKWGVFAQMYDENFAKFKTEFKVNTFTINSQWNPCVAGLSNGKFIVCWTSYGQDGSAYGIFAQIYKNNGFKIGNEFQVNTYTAGDQSNPSITGLSDSNFVVCWDKHDGDGSGIYAQMFNEDGTKIGNEFKVNTYTTSDQYGSSAVGLINGNFVICWDSYWQDGDKGGIFAQMYNEDGIKIGAEFRVNTYTTDSQREPSAVGLLNGNFVVCWSSYAQDGSDYSYGVFAQLFDENANKLGNEFLVNTYTTGHQWSPSITGLSDSNFAICWERFGQGGDEAGIYAQMFTNTGIKIGKEFKINTRWQARSNLRPSIAGLPNNNKFVVCWEDYQQDGSGEKDIFGKYFNNEPIAHQFHEFNLVSPISEIIINSNDIKFIWEKPSETHINFPWEVRYDLYIDTDTSFTDPIIISGNHDTLYVKDSLESYKTYYWKVLAANVIEDTLWSSNVFNFYTDPNVTHIKVIESKMQESFELLQNYPNPFNPITQIKYKIPKAGNIKIDVYDLLGEKIKTLVNEYKNAGEHSIEFHGEGLPSGIYFYRISSENYSKTKKMVLLK